MKGRDLVVELKKLHIKAGIKGQEPILDVCLPFKEEKVVCRMRTTL